MKPSAAALAWVSEQTGGRVVSAELLEGSTQHSSYVITLDLRSTRRVVLRCRSRGRGRPRDPEFTVEREVAALAIAARARLPAPRLIAADPGGRRCGTPALLATYLPGVPPRRASAPSALIIGRLAAAALAIHRVAGPWRGIPAYRPYHDLRDPRPPRAARRPDSWARAFAVVAGASPVAREVFIHRDYHPGNTLWVRGRLSGIVDWSTASRGPAGVDVGHMRWNLVLRHGERTAARFLEAYRKRAGGGYDHQPYWDLRTLVDLLSDHDPAPGEIARLEPYLEGLLARCGSGRTGP